MSKKPKPNSIPLLSIFIWALNVKKPKIRTTTANVINCGIIFLIFDNWWHSNVTFNPFLDKK